MYQVSEAFKTAMKRPVKQLRAQAGYEGNHITSADDLHKIKVSTEGGLLKTVMRKLEVKFTGPYNPVGKNIAIQIGVMLEDGSFSDMELGSFLCTEITTVKDQEYSTIIGYDNMIKFYVPYEAIFTYPISLFDFVTTFVTQCGVALGDVSIPNGDFMIESELFENIEGLTYVTVLRKVAEMTGTTAVIGNDDRLYFRHPTATGETITYANLFKLKLEPNYGPVNSLVLSRQPQEDNVVLKDDTSIETNGLTEIKISNNEFIDRVREDYITGLYNILNGLSYTPFEAETEGLGWYQVMDQFDVINDLGERYSTILLGYDLLFDAGDFKEKLYAKATPKETTKYQYAGGLTNRVKNTEIIVDKQEQYIKDLVSDMYEDDGKVNHNYTEIMQTISEITTSIQKSGGNNLIKNSVMFEYDGMGVPTEWTLAGSGSLDIEASTEAISQGSLSGHVFVLNDKTATTHYIQVKADSDDIPMDDKTYYSFSTFIKKNTVGTAKVRIYNDNEEYIIEIPHGTSTYYTSYQVEKILPTMDYYYIEFHGSADSDATFTDNTFVQGERKAPWTQANGEIMNTQVVMSSNGITVRSSIFLGDYTVMSPLEFSGYSIINGTLTRVFTLNKDTTEVEKLKARSSIVMDPIKVIPFTSAGRTGWAFVRNTEE